MDWVQNGTAFRRKIIRQEKNKGRERSERGEAGTGFRQYRVRGTKSPGKRTNEERRVAEFKLDRVRGAKELGRSGKEKEGERRGENRVQTVPLSECKITRLEEEGRERGRRIEENERGGREGGQEERRRQAKEGKWETKERTEPSPGRRTI